MTTPQHAPTSIAAAPAPMTQTPAPLTTLTSEISALVGVFSALLEEETAALKIADFKAVDALQTQKRDYAKRYHDAITELYARRDELAQMPPPVRGGLMDARARFATVLEDNLRALDAAKEGTRRLVNKILDTARRAVIDDRKTHYSGTGKAQAYKTATLSLSVDKNL